jgi:hypothetical protein
MTDYEKIYDFENLYEAHKKARRGKQNRIEVIMYEVGLAENLLRIAWHMKRGTYHMGSYRRFIIHDPKTREIQALPYGDRVVQHSLCDNVLGPYLDRRLIYDNAACRVGKGTHFAMNRVSGFLRDFFRKNGCDGYILKCDVRKYFDSIDHEVLKKRLGRLRFDSMTMDFLGMIVDSYEHSPGKGIPMGNQTSQWFALYYLDGLDRLVKERLRVRYYSRYMDDMILIHHDRCFLRETLMKMEEYADRELHLEFNEKTQIHHIREGVDYLGFHFYLTESGKVIRKLRQSGKKKLKRKLAAYKRLYKKDGIDHEAIRRSIISYKGHMKHGHTYALQRKIWGSFVLHRNTNEEQSNNIIKMNDGGNKT